MGSATTRSCTAGSVGYKTPQELCRELVNVDEVRSVEDKVPVLGDIPGLGRLFRSEGETRQKRNLLIFVTANLVSPGGSPARQNYRNVNANALFQNPTIMTPSSSANRSIEASGE